MAIASYEVVGSGGVWRVKHDGEPVGSIRLRGSRCCGVIGSSGRVRGPAFSTRDPPRILTGTVKPAYARRHQRGTRATSPTVSAHSRNPSKLIERDLDNGQRSSRFLPLSNSHHHVFGGRADSEIGLNIQLIRREA
jgi:hypothetical protein